MATFGATYIAETNEDGAVVWLWKKVEGVRHPHPIKRTRQHIEAIKSAEVSGASRDAMIAWIASQADRREEHAL